MPEPVSVIVLTWNGLEVTRNCVTTLLERTDHPDFEVVAVDNGSTDGTLEYLRSLEGIRLIENGENLGFVRGNNVGIRATSGDVLLLNNDTEVIEGDWLKRMQDLAYSADDIGLVGCRLVNADGRLVHAGTYMPTPSFWGQEYPGDEKDIGQLTRDREVEGVIAACVYIKRRVIDAIGALDEDYISYFEDTDYCLKAARAGFRVFCCGSATVKHLENASTDVNRMDFSGTFRRSRETFISKWKPYYDGRYSRKLTWRSFISGEGFLPEASAKLLWALDAAGVDLNLSFLEGAEKAELDDFRINDMKNRGSDRDRPQVTFAPADAITRGDGSYNIAYTFTRFDRFTADQVKELNRFDEVWVTDESQQKAAVDSGVKKDVHVIEPGVDPDYLSPSITGFPLSDRFTFLAPVEWGPAWAYETLIRAFTDEFAVEEKAVLVVKASSVEGGAEVEQDAEAWGLPMDRAPVVFVIDHVIPPYQDGSLYRSSDCLVLASREVGGRPLAREALACGVPVIDLCKGVRPLCTNGGVLEVESTLVPAPVEGAHVWEPDYAALRSALREAFTRGAELRSEAEEASREILARCSWAGTAAKMVERLDGIA